MRRWLYADDIVNFLCQSDQHIMGDLVQSAHFNVELEQRNAWSTQICLLKEALHGLIRSGRVYFEYVIPRLGKRIDCVLIIDHVLLLLEFKVGEKECTATALDQVWDVTVHAFAS